MKLIIEGSKIAISRNNTQKVFLGGTCARTRL